MKRSTTAPPEESPAAAIDRTIAALGDWRGEVLARVRAIILAADPEIVEQWKWSTPVWSKGGIVCTGESYKRAVKLTFAKGAALPDPKHLFNSSLEGNVRRAIDVHEGESIDAAALTALVRAAVAHNLAARPAARKPASKTPAASARKPASKTPAASARKPASKTPAASAKPAASARKPASTARKRSAR